MSCTLCLQLWTIDILFCSLPRVSFNNNLVEKLFPRLS